MSSDEAFAQLEYYGLVFPLFWRSCYDMGPDIPPLSREPYLRWDSYLELLDRSLDSASAGSSELGLGLTANPRVIIPKVTHFPKAQFYTIASPQLSRFIPASYTLVLSSLTPKALS